MHVRAELGQGVRGPVPAVRRFQHHLRRLAGAGHHLPQVLRVVGDPHRLQPLAGLGHPHQHRPAPMQIHPDDLPSRVCFAHRGLLESMDVSTPSMSRESRGAEAPLLHRIKGSEPTLLIVDRRSELRGCRVFAAVADHPWCTWGATIIDQRGPLRDHSSRRQDRMLTLIFHNPARARIVLATW